MAYFRVDMAGSGERDDTASLPAATPPRAGGKGSARYRALASAARFPSEVGIPTRN